ncbi:MAG: phosphoribosylformimino-5-aminoimidazole carboxamide ribotide isomerase [Lachnospiraceae bacterium]
MRFRPCIDIHNGSVKQIVGGSLLDQGDYAKENFVSEYDAVFYSNLYKKSNIKGGHIILLNQESSPYYETTKNQGIQALNAYPNGLQIGGGIHTKNATSFIEAGASHVIVTSFVFKDGKINYESLEALVEVVGKEKIVLDLSCRKKENEYYIVTDRWQKFTTVKLTNETFDFFAKYCDEFLVHAVDVEGKSNGIEEDLLQILGNWNKIPITYAGGVASFADLEQLKKLGKNKIDVTIGSSLDLFGGHMEYERVLSYCKE